MTPGAEGLLRALAPQVLGTVARRCGDFDAAEDAVQEALLAAARHWPRDGTPDSPRAWLVRAALRRVTDQVRSDRARRLREESAALREPAPAEVPGQDDSLALLFLCCHPSLTPPSAVALTLRAVGGLTTAEIARAFLVPEATMAQRVSRAKQRIRASGAPFRMPAPDERPQRLRSVLHVLYLMFNEGYTAASGPGLHRVDLADEAVRLARLLHRALPGDAEAAGLLALMLLTGARRAARTGPDGLPVPLAEQDRSLWDRAAVAEGTALLSAAIARGAVGAYQVQAAVAALHDRAPRAEDTDWPQIHALYGLLERLTGNPVVTLNRAVAAGMAHGPAAGLAVLDGLGGRLAGHHRLDAVRAHLLEAAGDTGGAAAHYAAAAARATNLPEKRHLTLRAARLRDRA
ncbi:RNA polymerase sigma factor [Streptomyces sp. NPDC001380]|uniref:RNA polymerase sigma factor n=1 Tax=Streptomyces sp. NPDC001380 TaxID=3364566 RepID=UPI00369263EE